MSMPTLAAGDFADWDDTAAFAEIVEHYDDRPARRIERWTSKRDAIGKGLGFRRHRTNERVS